MAVKHLIFDLYGTLADADRARLVVERAELLRFGADKWMVTDRPEEDFFGRFCRTKKVDEDELLRSFEEMERSTAFFAGIPRLLLELHNEGYTLNLLSNCGRSVQHFLAEEQEVFCLFETLTFSYEVGAIKPDRAMFEAVVEKLRAAPEECLMIGDSELHDVAGAKRAGLNAVHFCGRDEPVSALRKRIADIAKL